MKFFLVCLFSFVLPIGVILQENFDLIKAVTSNSYFVETHEIETEDGYILTVFRLPQGRKSNVTNPEPVLINHGMFGSAENFVLMGPGKSLAYVLADNGYDVWLMNDRGSWHSKRHKTLKPEQKEFWRFSWHEIGVYDIPAVIDYILNITNKTGLSYIGHSQGCTTVFVTGSERPEYNSKIKVMIGLGPGAIYKHMKNEYLRMAASYTKFLKDLANSLKIYQLPPPFLSADEIRSILQLLCGKTGALRNTCKSIFMLVTDASPEALDVKDISEMLPLLIASCSVKQVLHYAQLIKSGNFEQYDWGPEKNLQKHGTRYPPLYNFKNITFPVALFYGTGDNLVSDVDVKELAMKLPNVALLYNVPMKSFSHVDFLWATNPKLILKPILTVLKKYRTGKTSQT